MGEGQKRHCPGITGVWSGEIPNRFILVILRIRIVYVSIKTSKKLVVKQGSAMRTGKTPPLIQTHAHMSAAPVTLTFCGQPVSARTGASVAAALFAAGIRTLRTSPRNGAPRGLFCAMGSCQECLVMIGTTRSLACKTAVAEGMCVEQVPEAGADE
jgi:D-hydroxyproline dehydrogenase subunit gamma